MEEVWGPWGWGSQGLSLFGVKIQCEGDPHRVSQPQVQKARTTPRGPYRGRSLMVFPKSGLLAALRPPSFSWCVSCALMTT